MEYWGWIMLVFNLGFVGSVFIGVFVFGGVIEVFGMFNVLVFVFVILFILFFYGIFVIGFWIYRFLVVEFG